MVTRKYAFSVVSPDEPSGYRFTTPHLHVQTGDLPELLRDRLDMAAIHADDHFAEVTPGTRVVNAGVVEYDDAANEVVDLYVTPESERVYGEVF